MDEYYDEQKVNKMATEGVDSKSRICTPKFLLLLSFILCMWTQNKRGGGEQKILDKLTEDHKTK